MQTPELQPQGVRFRKSGLGEELSISNKLTAIASVGVAVWRRSDVLYGTTNAT